jgi:hypothetical protein
MGIVVHAQQNLAPAKRPGIRTAIFTSEHSENAGQLPVRVPCGGGIGRRNLQFSTA